MKSAATIRSCSIIMSAFVIVGSIAYGLFLALEEYFLYSIIILVVGILAGIMQNALFQGFADLIDNSYAIANKGKDVPETPVKE